MPNLLSLRSLINAIKLSRYNNLFIIFLTQYFCAIFLIGPSDRWIQIVSNPNLFGIVLSTILIAAAGYYINDYYDIKTDLVNKPEKVIVGTSLKRRPVMAAHVAMNFTGIAIGAWISPLIGLINATAAFLLWLYSNQLKRMPLIGNLVVGVLTSASLLVLAVYFKSNYFLVFIYAYFAGFFTLIREIIKDVEDMEGDSAFGSESLPIAIGIRRTKNMLYLLLFLFSFSILYFLGQIRIENLWVYFSILTVPFTYFIYLLIHADTKAQFSRLSRFCKWLMVSGVISMSFIAN